MPSQSTLLRPANHQHLLKKRAGKSWKRTTKSLQVRVGGTWHVVLVSRPRLSL